MMRNFLGTLPKSNIVVCSDRPDLYIGGLQTFADRVMGDMDFEIIDGNHPSAQGLVPDAATYVYMGHTSLDLDASACLARYPELAAFFGEKRNDTPISEVGPGGFKLGPSMRRAYYAQWPEPQPKPRYDNQLFICDSDSFACAAYFYTAIFQLPEEFCTIYDVCPGSPEKAARPCYRRPGKRSTGPCLE